MRFETTHVSFVVKLLLKYCITRYCGLLPRRGRLRPSAVVLFSFSFIAFCRCSLSKVFMDYSVVTRYALAAVLKCLKRRAILSTTVDLPNACSCVVSSSSPSLSLESFSSAFSVVQPHTCSFSASTGSSTGTGCSYELLAPT